MSDLSSGNQLRRGRLALALCSALIVVGGSGVASVQAADLASAESVEVHAYDLPAQALADALQAFARISQQQVSFDAAALAGLRSPPVRGDLAVAEALSQLLQGSGLQAERGNHGIWMVRRSSASSAAPATEPTSEPTAKLDTLLVTGTHIRDVAPVGAPVLVIDAEQIRRSGYSGTEQVLQALPQNFRGGEAGASADVNFSTGSQRGFNMTSGSGVNLRGLGSNATLLLINGRRVAASSGGTFTDISMIPLSAIERIEVLTDGASAVYGADAVAGVVNVILKSDYDSAETRIDVGATTESGREESRIAHTFGTRWSSGGLMASADHLQQSQLYASERSFTAHVPGPTSVFPSNSLSSLVLNVDQDLGERLSMRTELQYARSKRDSVSTSAYGRSESTTRPERRNLVLAFDYMLAGDWVLSLDLHDSEEDARSRLFAFDADNAPDYDYLHTRIQQQSGLEFKSSGSLFELPGGPVKLAAGVAYKEESYFRTIDLYGIEHRADRHNRSAFAELHLPIIGAAQARPGLERLELSIAARHDDYSDFGTTNNPRFGLRWLPLPGLSLRASHSTSFRAPAIGEEARFSNDGLLGIELSSFYAEDGESFVPVLMLLGSEPLKPEEATNRSFGIDWQPAGVPGLSLGLGYYDIAYTDRILLPPLDYGVLSNPELQAFVQRLSSPEEARALVEFYTAQGVRYEDYTFGEFGPDPLGQTLAVFSYMWTNAQRVDMSGFDLNAGYRFGWREHAFELGVSASYIDEIDTRLSPTAIPFDLVGTFGNPPRLRMRGLGAWTVGAWSSTLHLNYAHSYTDTSGLLDRPVATYTTADLVTRYSFDAGRGRWADGLSLSLAVTNLADRAPPYIESSGRGAHYDAANASPLGRMVNLQLQKRW
jgi:iron complex outermembrane receptor protein